MVANGPEPRDGVETLVLAEQWRVGGPGDDDALIGVVGRVLADDEGRVYVLDMQQIEVQVYDRDGRCVQRLGRRGDGPGELNLLIDAVRLGDGTVGLVQPFPGRIVLVDSAGDPAGEIPAGDPTTGGFAFLVAAASRGGLAVVVGTRMTIQGGTGVATSFVDRVVGDRLSGSPLLETTRPVGQTDSAPGDVHLPVGGQFDIDRDGRVAMLADRDEYRIDVYGPDDVRQFTVTREAEPLLLTEAEKAAIAGRLAPTPGARGNRQEFRVPDVAAAVQKLHWSDAGELWVLPAHGTRDQPPGVHSTWDVFTPDGVFARRVRVACDADPERDEVHFPGGDLVVIVTNAEDAMDSYFGNLLGAADGAAATENDDDLLQIVCYRPVPPGTPAKP
ncbi:6-bladed beta-propeller [bacterium]|nr:6-bladed beta-propeller [bacterium]